MIHVSRQSSDVAVRSGARRRGAGRSAEATRLSHVAGMSSRSNTNIIRWYYSSRIRLAMSPTAAGAGSRSGVRAPQRARAENDPSNSILPSLTPTPHRPILPAMHHIGILAHSADGAALCFLEMVRDSARRLEEHHHPEITLSVLPMAPVLEAYDRNELGAVRAHLARTASRLANAGCDFFVCPDNTAHIALEADGAPLPLPGLHIAEIVAQRAKAEGRRCVGLVGTRWTMAGSVYPRALARAGLAMKAPPAEDREFVNDVIFGELCQGVI